MKRQLFFAFVILGVGITGYFIFHSTYGKGVTLEEEKAIDKKFEDFILHMKVEQAPRGIYVHQSLQYVGRNPIEIKHQTPLISVSLDNQNHDFTGSLVTRELHRGNIYYQDTISLPRKQRGECNLYIKARFIANGEIVDIQHVENLMFN
ncbi:hypothetical protein [Oceanobacillus senegalensis]|uniref:hypothetical protein n=1 Tax=Oceanobacillus senegalensis TaxID=1936063 RepID=UPI000A30D883|nr:hypothetical protein [Oceanobacillus senegalensis]